MTAPPVHDFTKRCWGHNIENVGKGRIVGWSWPRPNEGDLARWVSDLGVVTKRLVNVEHCRDPDDMWFANYEDPVMREISKTDKAIGVVGMVLCVTAFVVCVWAVCL